jgi:two-component system response regulator AtoC
MSLSKSHCFLESKLLLPYQETMSSSTTRVYEPLIDAGMVFGQGASLLNLNAMVAGIAITNIPVLLIGESGTGKEVYARLIHRLSPQRNGTLKRLSCRALDAATLPKQLQSGGLEASSRRASALGTLFLDSIDELDLAAQRALLSYLPDGESNSEEGPFAFRIICSTSHDLEKEIDSGRFRRELYFRINGACVRLPSLRERKKDIPELLHFFFARHANGLKGQVPTLGPEELDLLASYAWPGNIRELENLAKKILALGDSKTAMGDLRSAPPPQKEVLGFPSLKVAARVASRRAERELILQALERTHWNRKRAARDLQISYKSLLYKIKQIGVHESDSNEFRGGGS